MSKIDVFKTLTAMADAYRSEETALNTPFILVIKKSNKAKRAQRISSCTTDSMIELYQAVLGTTVKVIKDSVPKSKKDEAYEIVTEIMLRELLKVMAAAFPKEVLMTTEDTIENIIDKLRGETE